MENVCPNAGPCPIFNGILKDMEITAKNYRKMYCESGESKYSACKRYMTKANFGKCPQDLLPNCSLSMDQIGEKYHLA